jgi:hypothetical protein
MRRSIIIPMIVSLCAALIMAMSGSVFAANLHGTQDDFQRLHQPAARQGAKAKSVKLACSLLAKALRSDGLAAVLTYVRSIGTKEAAATISKNAATIAKTLDELVKWEELSMAMVRGQVGGALIKAGVAESNAKTAAYWIQEVVSGLFM